jgi:hypothetical protein
MTFSFLRTFDFFQLIKGCNLSSHSGLDIDSIIDDAVEFRRDVRQLALNLKPARQMNAVHH